MPKLRVAVLYGGPSKEHDISVMSGESMLKALEGGHYQVTGILISVDGEWDFGGKKLSQNDAIKKLKEDADFVLLGLHGTFGEDGTIQALLEENKIKYSGSGSHASRLAMDKHETSKLFTDASFKVPRELNIKEGYESDTELLLKKFELPVIVKPNKQGSSVGITKVKSADQLIGAIDLAIEDGEGEALIQEYIKGTEVSCGVIEDETGKLVALPPTELIPLRSDFFDYDSKYNGTTNEVTPPNLPEQEIERIQKLAVSAHRVVSCSGYSRTDMILKDDDLYVIEINTLPGMTSASIMPQQAQTANISLAQLLDLIIQAGIRKGV